MPSDDPEWIYAFNRHRFFICLGQAYAMTGDEKYAKTFVHQVCDWIDKVKREDKDAQLAWRTIEAGLRLEYWLKAICYFEDSPYLTDEVCDKFFGSIVDHLAYRNGIFIPNIMTEKVKDMCMVNLIWKKPNHHEVMQGDSDDIDVRDIITKGAYLFKDPILKFGSYETFDFDCIWDLGIKALEEYKLIPMEAPKATAHALLDSGNFYMRSDWSEKAKFLHFYCGTLGAGHGHSDKLHFDLFANDEDILIDAGRYTYVDKPERYDKIIYIKPDIYILVDAFYTGNSHSYQQYFHFNNKGLVTDDNHVVYLSDKNVAEIVFATKDIRKTLMPSKVSRHYNQYEENIVLKTESEGKGFKTIITVIGVSDKDKREMINVKKVSVKSNFKDIIFEDNMIEAINISKGKRSYTVVVAHQEYASPTDTFNADGCTGFGQVVIFNRTIVETRIGNVLKW